MQSNTLPSKIKTRIVIGAGDSGTSGDYTSQHLVLVVPDMKQAERLRAQHVDTENVKILAVGIGATDGTGKLRRFTLARVNSLRQPTGLTALMPGLRSVSEESVELLSVATLLKRLGNPEGPVHLTINDPGNEQIILAGWEEDGILARTESLELHAPRESLYTEAVGMNGLEDWLLARGFQVFERNAEDPDWPVIWFRQDVEGRALKQQLTELTAERDAARAETDEQRTVAETTAANAQKKIAELTAERDAARAETDEQRTVAETTAANAQKKIAELTAERDAARAETDEQRTVAETTAANAQKKIAELTAERDAARAETDEQRTVAETTAANAQKKIAELTAERDAEKKDADQKKSEIAKQQEQASNWEKKALEFEHRLSRARDDLRRAEGQLEIVKDLLLRGERL